MAPEDPGRPQLPVRTGGSLLDDLRRTISTGTSPLGLLPDDPAVLGPERERLNQFVEQLSGLLQGMAEAEAIGDPDAQQARVAVLAARSTLENWGISIKDDISLPDLKKKIEEIRSGMVQHELAAGGARTGELERRVHIAKNLGKGEIDLLRTEQSAARDLIEERLRHQREVAALGQELAHRDEVVLRATDRTRELAAVQMRELVDRGAEIADKDLKHRLGWLATLDGNLPVVIALGAQVVSGYLSAQGIAAMMRHENGTDWHNYVVPGAISTALNGAMLYLTASHHAGGWTFRRNKGVAMGFALTAALTVGTNYAGMASSFVSEDVASYAASEPIARTQDFQADLKPVLKEKVEEPVAEHVQAVIDGGMALLDEATGKGRTRQYGFKGESIERLREYRVDVSDAVKALSPLGTCEGIEDIQKAYQDAMDRLQAERDKNPGFSASDFVTVDTEGNLHYDLDLSAQVKQCEESNPSSPQDLSSEVDNILQSIESDLANGRVNDTTELNPRIRQLNDKMSKLSAMLPVEAAQLDEMDPMFFETWKIFFDTMDRIWERLTQGGSETILAWPIVMLLFSGFMDQVGMFVSLASGATRQGRKQVLEDRARELVHLQRLDQLGKRADTWYSRLRSMFSRKA